MGNVLLKMLFDRVILINRLKITSTLNNEVKGLKTHYIILLLKQRLFRYKRKKNTVQLIRSIKKNNAIRNY